LLEISICVILSPSASHSMSLKNFFSLTSSAPPYPKRLLTSGSSSAVMIDFAFFGVFFENVSESTAKEASFLKMVVSSVSCDPIGLHPSKISKKSTPRAHRSAPWSYPRCVTISGAK